MKELVPPIKSCDRLLSVRQSFRANDLSANVKAVTCL